MKVVSLWSGGKDSCFACHKAMIAGYEVVNLLNMVSSDGLRSLSHGLDARRAGRMNPNVAKVEDAADPRRRG